MSYLHDGWGFLNDKHTNTKTHTQTNIHTLPPSPLHCECLMGKSTLLRLHVVIVGALWVAPSYQSDTRLSFALCACSTVMLWPLYYIINNIITQAIVVSNSIRKQCVFGLCMLLHALLLVAIGSTQDDLPRSVSTHPYTHTHTQAHSAHSVACR